MSITKYERILGSFVVIAVFLVLIFIAVVAKDGDGEERIEGWQTVSSGGLEFQSPLDFSTEYIKPVDWPPQVQVLSEPFSCLEAGQEMARAGLTSLRRINGREYCVTETITAAAGSTYTQYAYVFPFEGSSAVMTFSTRAPQCGNYPEIEMSKCQGERDVFSMDAVMDRVIQTIKK